MYTVTLNYLVEQTATVDVEAESEEDAKEKADEIAPSLCEEVSRDLQDYEVEEFEYHFRKERIAMVDFSDEAVQEFNPTCQVSAKISLTEKTALYSLIRSKGCDGLTGYLKMLAKAKEVQITI